MGKHVINGIDYSGGSGGGGGDNSVEISYADYLALSDAERNNGKIYYITDANPTSADVTVTLDTMEEIEANTEENKIAGALAVKELYNNNIPKPPTTDTTISTDFTSGNTYTADEDCWLVAAATLESETQYGLLTIYDKNLSYYQDKEIAYGANSRTFLVKLYVKKGTSVIVNGQGAISAIALHKLV